VEVVDIPTQNKSGPHQAGGGQGQRIGRATLLLCLVEY